MPQAWRQNLSPPTTLRSSRVNAKYIFARSRSDRVRLNYLLHFGIYELAKTKVLLDVISNLWALTKPSAQLYSQSYQVVDVANNHARIVTALKRRDTEG